MPETVQAALVHPHRNDELDRSGRCPNCRASITVMTDGREAGHQPDCPAKETPTVEGGQPE